MAVIIAFSAGLESTALLDKALRSGRTVILAVINVSGNPYRYLLEVHAAMKIVDWYDARQKEYSGKIENVIFYHSAIWPALQDGNKSSAITTDIVQQFSTVLTLIQIRRLYPELNYGVWIGWLKEDAAEFSLNDWDYSEKDYKDLLELNAHTGIISASDARRTVFRAPFWDTPKEEIYKSIPEDLFKLTLPNGSANPTESDGFIGSQTYDSKIEEYERIGVTLEKMILVYFEDIPLIAKLIAGVYLGIDKQIGIDDCPDFLLDVFREKWLSTPRFTMKRYWGEDDDTFLQSELRNSVKKSLKKISKCVILGSQ